MEQKLVSFWSKDRIFSCTLILESVKLPKQECKSLGNKQGEPDGVAFTAILTSLSKYLAAT